jgi:serine/threonine protein kinase
LGTPNRDEVRAMNPANSEFKYPTISSKPWNTIFRPSVTADAIHLITRMLTYTPDIRVKAIEACAHPFFDELRDPNTTMPDRTPLMPELFQFTQEELLLATPEVLQVLNSRLVPHPSAIVNATVAASSHTTSATSSVESTTPIVSMVTDAAMGQQLPQQQQQQLQQTTTVPTNTVGETVENT